MMYGYTTLPDNTGIAHSELQPDGSVLVYFEKPVTGGVHHAECRLPDCKWQENHGFSYEELRSLKNYLQENSEAILDSARKLGPGAFFSAVPEEAPTPPQQPSQPSPPPSQPSVPVTPPRQPSAPVTPSPQSPKSSGSGKGKKFFAWIITIAVCYGIGSLLGRLVLPRQTVTAALKSQQTAVTIKASLPTLVPTSTPRPSAVNTAQDVSGQQKEKQASTHWNYLEATDSEILSAMHYFWCGKDSKSGAKCAFFLSADEKHGGYMWLDRSSGVRAEFLLGDVEETSNTSLVIYDKEGEKASVSLVLYDNDRSIDFIVSPSDVFTKSVHMKMSTEYKDEMLKLILNYAHTLQKMRN